MSRLRVAIVGCGEVARRAHGPALVRNADVEVVGLCDPNEKAIALLQQRTGLRCPAFTSVEALLRNASPDAAHICTPGQTHFEVAAECLRNGVHVLVEKPPALNSEHVQELALLARARGLKAGAVLNTRYRETTVALKAALDSGRLGRIVKIHVTHHANLVYGESPFLWDERASKYLVYEFGIHLLDLLVYLCGPHETVSHVHRVYQPSIDLTTGLDMTVSFKNGTTATLDLTCDSTRHSSYLTQINVYGTGMDAFVRYFPPVCRFAAGVQNPMQILTSEARALGSILMKIGTGRFLRHRNETHAVVIDNFVRWIREEREFETELAAITPTMALLDEVAAHVPAYASVDVPARTEAGVR